MTFEQFKLTVYDKLALELEPNNSFHLNNLMSVTYDGWGITLEFKVPALKNTFKVNFSDRKIEEWWLLVGQNVHKKDEIWWAYIGANIKTITKDEFLKLLTKDWERLE